MGQRAWLNGPVAHGIQMPVMSIIYTKHKIVNGITSVLRARRKTTQKALFVEWFEKCYCDGCWQNRFVEIIAHMHHSQTGSDEKNFYFSLHLFIVFCGRPLKSFFSRSYLSSPLHSPALHYVHPHCVSVASFSSVAPHYLLQPHSHTVTSLLSCVRVRVRVCACNMSSVSNKPLQSLFN